MSEVERPLSSLSISSSQTQRSDLDWDRSSQNPSTPPTRLRDLLEEDGDDNATPGRQPRSLANLLRLYAEKGTDLRLTKEEERRLKEALNNWVNGEDDDASYKPASSDDDEFSGRSRSTTLVGSVESSPTKIIVEDSDSKPSA